MTGLSEEDLESSLDTLREMARRLGATIQVLRERVVTMEVGTRTVAEVLVRKVRRNGHAFEWIGHDLNVVIMIHTRTISSD